MNSRNIDFVLRTFISNKFFTRGWGKPELFQSIAELQNLAKDETKFVRDVYGDLEKASRALKFSKGKPSQKGDVVVFQGEFKSPLNRFVPEALPEKCVNVAFEVILPKHWRGQKPVCIHLPPTGDHYFWRRRNLTALPLAKEHGIGSIILQNPFYGCRKPGDQKSSAVNHVSDIFVMGAALFVEVIILLLWCKQKGLGPLGISGVSLGAHMATMAQSGWFEPLSVVPCLTWTSAGPCFTEGVLSKAVDWRILESQLDDNVKYATLLRDDMEFRQNLLTHYTNLDYLAEMRKKEEKEDVGFLQQISSSIASVSQKIGIETGTYQSIYKYVDSLSSSSVNSDYLRNLLSRKSNEDFKPSQHTLDFMLTLMDQYTHLSHVKHPANGSKVIYVSARHDGFFPAECYNLGPQDVWGDVEIREIDSCHVMGILMHHKDFNEAIRDAFQYRFGAGNVKQT